MGKLLQVYRSRPFLPIDDGSVNKAVVAQAWPHPVLYAVQYLPQELRSEFPTLSDICPATSDRYENETLWLSPEEVRSLHEEFGRFQQICECEVHVAGVDGAEVKRFWESSLEHDSSSTVSSLNEVLKDATLEGHWVCLRL